MSLNYAEKKSITYSFLQYLEVKRRTNDTVRCPHKTRSRQQVANTTITLWPLSSVHLPTCYHIGMTRLVSDPNDRWGARTRVVRRTKKFDREKRLRTLWTVKHRRLIWSVIRLHRRIDESRTDTDKMLCVLIEID